MEKHLFIFILTITLLGSCTHKNGIDKQIEIAKVYDKILFHKDLKNIVPENISKSDSTALAQDFIDKWIRRELLLHKAELSLSDEEKDVQKQIDDYKTSLIIFKFEQNYIKQKMDTVVSDSDILTYYSQYSSNFVLNTPIIKGLYLKIPKSAPEIWKIKTLYKSKTPEDFPKLEQYAFEFAEQFEYFEDNWILAASILAQIPNNSYSTESLLKSRSSFETMDSSYHYLLKITEYKLESDIAPLEYVHDKVISILLNKRKIELVNKLESEIYNDALNRKNFNID